MTIPTRRAATLDVLDDATRRLVRTAAVIAAGDELAIRAALADASEAVRTEWVEELILQSYLFCGFPRSLNAMREWRRLTGNAVAAEVDDGDTAEWRRRGEETCQLVYGEMYERLRVNIRGLHPELDEWMIVEGYGKVLSRPGLDLGRRELCIVAACAASGQDRQLHSHLRGALNVGVPSSVIDDALQAIVDLIGDERARSVRLLLARVRGK